MLALFPPLPPSLFSTTYVSYLKTSNRGYSVGAGSEANSLLFLCNVCPVFWYFLALPQCYAFL